MVSAGNVTQLVGRLAKEGLVVRKVQGNDRRYAKAILTKNGRAVFRDIASANERWIDQSLRYMNSADVAQLVILLKKLRQSIDRTVSDSST
jgi:DNA-binding MarR family transcriptional regulator